MPESCPANKVFERPIEVVCKQRSHDIEDFSTFHLANQCFDPIPLSYKDVRISLDQGIESFDPYFHHEKPQASSMVQKDESSKSLIFVFFPLSIMIQSDGLYCFIAAIFL